MLKAFFIVNNIFLLAIYMYFPNYALAEKKPIIITSETLIADNKDKIVIFEGSVVAINEDVVMYSDRMEISYNNSQGEIAEIRAYGNVRVHKKERAIFSQEAIYSSREEKFVFTGNPRAVEGENVITGTEIIYFLKDDRVIVKNSRVVLKKNGE